ncbi:MAG TPA: isopenicillin N synthase family oxygenase [Gammaproteobacteria bacterium]|nr:oxidoreductase [Gammaproteobacteria bacterium]HBF08223.1 isopenicillin N synthase family oxygenase [Gammaproteobacteria bacterium]HCK93848.1 isopenicillin N synthase family oxygenase [Gammaproteobacteria bacterium]|tara:strand:- start:7566 stop:8513 length:948 start_codon:yes stop_codon:yes gene_type:complete
MKKTNRQVAKLNLSDYQQTSTKDVFIEQLMTNLKEFGFIVLDDHPVKQQLVDAAYESSKAFFSLPTDTKMKYFMNNGGQRGYTPYKIEHAKDQKQPDLKEFWHVGRDISADHTFKAMYPNNLWPEEVSAFQASMQALYSALDETAAMLLDAIGEGLGLEAAFFQDMIKDGNSILRLIHYPPTQDEDTTQALRAAPHADINLITLLVGATDSGLELLDKDGHWLPVQSAPGQIVVDTGDMMSRITNNVLPSTIHRVVNPDDSGKERFSMPYFVHPHPNALLECIPSCKGQGELYPPIKSMDFLMQRLKEIGLIEEA